MFHSYFDRVVCINLPYKRDRWRAFRRRASAAGLDVSKIQRVNAISGDMCGHPSWWKAGAGAWGCMRTHARVLEDAIMDGVQRLCVFEDDVIFSPFFGQEFAKLVDSLPDDWDQLYLGGQHLRSPEAMSIGDKLPFFVCKNVNRTHAMAFQAKAMTKCYQHISHAPDYIQHPKWHIDHQLGYLHSQDVLKVVAPMWWLCGQAEGSSNISGRVNPQFFWHTHLHVDRIPFVYIPSELRTLGKKAQWIHTGNNLETKLQDVGLIAVANHQRSLISWMHLIAREALDYGKLPGIQHPQISIDKVRETWKRPVLNYSDINQHLPLEYD